MRNCVVLKDGHGLGTGMTADGLVCLGESSEEYRLAARHSLLSAKGTGLFSLVSRTVNQIGLLKIWNFLVFFIVDLSFVVHVHSSKVTQGRSM